MHMAVVLAQHSQRSGVLTASEAHLSWFETKSSENNARLELFITTHPNRSPQADCHVLRRDGAIPFERPLIAVVDDEPVIAITLAEILMKHGFDAVWFSCPTEALAFFIACLPDLLLSDISMPKMDGIALAAKILDLTSECAIFLLSARSHETEVLRQVRSLKAAVHVEAKPLNVVSLVTTIHRLLGIPQNRPFSHEGQSGAILTKYPAR
jgi:CheY-like chemotaxis protein